MTRLSSTTRHRLMERTPANAAPTVRRFSKRALKACVVSEFERSRARDPESYCAGRISRTRSRPCLRSVCSTARTAHACRAPWTPEAIRSPRADGSCCCAWMTASTAALSIITITESRNESAGIVRDPINRSGVSAVRARSGSASSGLPQPPSSFCKRSRRLTVAVETPACSATSLRVAAGRSLRRVRFCKRLLKPGPWSGLRPVG